LHAAAAIEAFGAEHPAQLRQQRAQAGISSAGNAICPEGVDQLVSAHRAEPVSRKIGEQQLALPPRKLVFDATSRELDHNSAAQLDPGGHGIVLAPLEAVQTPVAGDPFQGVQAAIGECEPGAG
jgi:hypothetical protein